MRKALGMAVTVLLTTGWIAFAQGDLVEGEIMKVDNAAEKLTIRHGDIPNLDMPSMTMVFRVADPAMLQQVTVGDHIRFTADRVNGAITVMSMQKD